MAFSLISSRKIPLYFFRFEVYAEIFHISQVLTIPVVPKEVTYGSCYDYPWPVVTGKVILVVTSYRPQTKFGAR